jgi:diguanylate cyclase (GGDEF)-like protein
MPLPSQAPWAFDLLPASPARERAAHVPLRRLLAWAALAIAHAEREGSHLALLFVDLDGFKAVNDSFGHAFGDRFLVELQGVTRPG